MQTQYQLKMPQAVYCGVGALEQIKTVLTQNAVKRLAVFTDQGIEKAGLLEKPLAYVRACGVQTVTLSDLPPEPTYAQAQKMVDAFRASGADFIMAIGGGSVIDTAKLASVLATDAYGIKELLDDPGRAKKHVRTLVIPTTAGTGAEATPNAIVAVPERDLKVGIVNANMISDFVILDAEMVKNLPTAIAAATGVDALAHAIECFTSQKANPMSDLFALQALDLILNHIEPACEHPDALEAKNQMQLASFYAGVAITASGTTAVHALSYPLGGKYHIPHGVSNAMLLAPVMRFNEPGCRAKFAQAYDRCMHQTHSHTTEAEKSAALLAWMERIVQRLKIPTSLRAFGVPQEDLPGLVAAGMQVTRLLVNNLREMTAQDAEAIYREIL